MLIPKRVKRRRQHRGRMKGTAQKGNKIAYGEYGLVAEDVAREAMRLASHKLPIKCKFVKKEAEGGEANEG